jgi:hypothetical protein
MVNFFYSNICLILSCVFFPRQILQRALSCISINARRACHCKATSFARLLLGRRSMSSPSWRSLLSGFLGWTRATGEKVPEFWQQQLPFTDQSVPQAVASNPNLHAFTFTELSAATGGFASGNKIGEGRFGAVYRGSLDRGRRQTGPPGAGRRRQAGVGRRLRSGAAGTHFQPSISFSCARVTGRPVS